LNEFSEHPDVLQQQRYKQLRKVDQRMLALASHAMATTHE
jgi:hypothetical protein